MTLEDSPNESQTSANEGEGAPSARGNTTQYNSILDLDKTGEDGRPDWLDSKLWDAEKKEPKHNEVLNALRDTQSRVDGLRSKLAKGLQNTPEKAEAYTFNIEGQNELMESLKDDPAVSVAKNAAHKAGLSQEQFDQFMQDVIPALQKAAGDQGAKDDGLSDEERVAAEAQADKEYLQAEMAKLGPSASQLISANSSFIQDLLSSGQIDGDMAEELRGLAATAKGIETLNFFRESIGGESVMHSPVPTEAGAPSDSEIHKLINSEDYARDPDTRAKVERMLTQRSKAGRIGPLQVNL